MSIFKLELIPAQHDKATIAQSCSIHVYCVLSSVQTDASYSSVLFFVMFDITTAFINYYDEQNSDI